MRLRVVLAVLVVAVAVAAAALLMLGGRHEAQPPTPSGATYPLTVVDSANRTVTIERRPERLVAVGPGMLRLLVYLNASDLVVGVEQAEKQWSPLGRDYAMALGSEYFSSKPVIGPGGPDKPPAPELILKVQPDLVVMSYALIGAYDPDRLQSEVGVPVVVVNYGTVGNVDVPGLKRALSLLGRVLGRDERARQLSEYIDGVVQDLSRRTAGLAARPSVYVGAVSFKGAQPFTSTQSPYPPLLLLNTPSVADEAGKGKGFVSLDFEYLLKAQPEYVFIDEGNLQSVLQDFQKSPEKYCALKAFREGRVYGVLPFNYYWTNVATALANAYYMGSVLYPDRFKDIDPASKADEIFRAFLGKPIYRGFVDRGYPGFANLSSLFKCP
ncbi:ABC transporter substrate-binding protein [Infirmifilum sp. NZ]|uniref:ABC transporter substrate-binding protein n=1 Tax=Infirmifilum sp. NZ TaxID=2926850 RepID=UPI00279BEDA4|nr:ABC transporter substrate-binding protein [Infirmifilum sp. NZ]UNQ73318.1 ABC transporter substrate-binding protein [Infirmifilum sp. NZ]